MTAQRTLSQVEGMLTVDLLRANYYALSADTGSLCKQLVVDYLELSGRISNKSTAFILHFAKVANNIIESDVSSLDGLLEKLYNFDIEGARITTDNLKDTPLESLNLDGHLLSFAADAARILYERTGDLTWAEKWYKANVESADLSVDKEPRHSANAYSFAGNTAKILYRNTGNIVWAEKWHEAKKKSADMTANTDPSSSAYAYGFAADAARILYERTGDLTWAKKWYEGNMISAKMTTDPRYSANAYSFAGDAARAINRATQSPQWAADAIECYTKFLEYFKRNPEPKMQRTVTIIEGHLTFLGRFAISI